MTKIGERVGAVLSTDGENVKLIGFGVYVGYEIPHEDVLGAGTILREIGATNPKIKLDSGQDVFGCECWWGSEEKVKDLIGDRNVIFVDIDEIREQERLKVED